MYALARGLSATLLLCAAGTAAARNALPAGFVYLREVAPAIAQDMRYASADNFTGRPLPGYDAGECVLRHDAALALARVEADLGSQGLGLKVYDCYRPTRAVAAMARWTHTPDRSTRRFYPALDKTRLFSLGYIAAHSAHSTGTAVDLTLVRRDAKPAAAFDAHADYGPCTGAVERRAPDNSLDLGTGFDCFSPKSFTASAAITPQQRRWRDMLLAAMHRHGFHNYFREWWHFTYGPRPKRAYDFPIEAR